VDWSCSSGVCSLAILGVVGVRAAIELRAHFDLNHDRMNSYPIELLCQHVPLMFIAGLDLPKDTKDPFHPLVTRLRESFLSLPKGLVWDQERSTNFNILLVDKVSGRKPFIHISY